VDEVAQKPEMDPIKRNWIWEIHKNCDALLHQRLAAFTTAQSMALASFTLLTVARFNADPCKISGWRIMLLDFSRFWIVLFGLFLSYATYMVTAPMLMRLDYLNEKYFFPNDPVYKEYIECIENAEFVAKFEKRVGSPSLDKLLLWRWSSKRQSFYKSYRSIIAVKLPTVELLFWTVLGLLLLAGMTITLSGGTPGCPPNPQQIGP